MRFRLEATHEEVQKKMPDLINTLATRFDIDLSKALPPKEQELKYKALQQLQKKTTAIYNEHMAMMDKEIQKLIVQKLKKGMSHEEGTFDTLHAGPERVPHEGHGHRADWDSGHVEHINNDGHQHNELEKADFTKPIIAKEEAAYERVKSVFKQRGYRDTDFDEGGMLYGLSVNELRELLKEAG